VTIVSFPDALAPEPGNEATLRLTGVCISFQLGKPGYIQDQPRRQCSPATNPLGFKGAEHCGGNSCAIGWTLPEYRSGAPGHWTSAPHGADQV